MVQSKKILVVDDEEKIIHIIKLYLENSHYHVISATNGKTALNLFKNDHFDLIILDLMIPDVTGEAICQEIRKTSRVPIILLTAKTTEESVLNGFSLGADDYVMKPFSPRQLMARVQAILRRNETPTFQNKVSYQEGKLVIDYTSYEVYRNGEFVNLTPIEFKVLALLSGYPNKVFSREDIIAHIYENDFEGYDRAIDSHIKNLRKKLGDNPPQYVLTVHGLGYKFGGGVHD